MVTKNDVDTLMDEYTQRFENSGEQKPYKTAYGNLLIAIKRKYSRTFWDYYTSPNEVMPEDIEQPYSRLKTMLSMKLIKKPEPSEEVAEHG